MSVIDFHSHILPGIDDGSKDKDMSLLMLGMEASAGVNTVVATPHFYADKMEVDSFVSRRAAAYDQIKDAASSMGIDIITGAEVCYFRTLHESKHLEKFLIGDTRLMLVEMPFEQWGRTELNTINGLIDEGIKPIIAHLERFVQYQKDKKPMEDLLSMKVICQFNSSPLLKFMERGKVIKLMNNCDYFLMGTDCHNTTSRCPNLKEGRDVVAKKFGEDVLLMMDEFGNKILRT